MEVSKLLTVVIAQQKYIDDIKEYDMLLGPLLKDKDIVLCAWDTEKALLSEAVPALYSTVASKGDWRCIVVCDEEGISRRNPFDLISPEIPDEMADASEKERYKAAREAKFKAYEAASQKPLARLAAHLCRFPLIDEKISFPELSRVSDFDAKDLGVGAGGDPDDLGGTVPDWDLLEYQAEIEKKFELYKMMRGPEDDDIVPPSEIICVAQRCEKPNTYDIRTSWKTHLINQYSRFYDRNLYFDKMRYLIVDMLPKSHNNYPKDHIKLLYSILILAGNDIPNGTISANRVYRLDCVTDEKALGNNVRRYDRKLQLTDERLEKEIYKITHEEKKELSDEDAKSMFCRSVNIPVNVVDRFDTQTLYVKGEHFGFAGDCPTPEPQKWSTLYKNSIKALTAYLKLPRRAVRRSQSDFRLLNDVDTDRVKDLDQFQREDVEDFIGDSEIAMVSVETPDIYDPNRYEKKLKAASDAVTTFAETRMNKAATIGLGVFSLLMLLICFLPMIFKNRGGFGSVSLAVIVTVVAVGLMLVGCLVFLFLSRHKLLVKVSDYNAAMREVNLDVENGMQQYSKYLTNACAMMRGFSVVNYDKEHEDNNTLAARIRTKHRKDISRIRAEFRELYGDYLEAAEKDDYQVEPYDYNFEREIDYSYPVPMLFDEENVIEYLQPDNRISCPVNYVDKISVELEELYD